MTIVRLHLISDKHFTLTLSYIFYLQILKPSEKKAKYQYGGLNSGRPVTPPRGPQAQKKK